MVWHSLDFNCCKYILGDRPKDPVMKQLLCEFLFLVCKFNFEPILSKIGTKSNHVADYISRQHDPVHAREFFSKLQIPIPQLINVPESWFSYSSDWWSFRSLSPYYSHHSSHRDICLHLEPEGTRCPISGASSPSAPTTEGMYVLLIVTPS